MLSINLHNYQKFSLQTYTEARKSKKAMNVEYRIYRATKLVTQTLRRWKIYVSIKQEKVLLLNLTASIFQLTIQYTFFIRDNSKII